MANVVSFRTVGFGIGSLLVAMAASSCGGAQGDDDGADQGGASGTTATGGTSTGGTATGGTATGGTATGGTASGGSAGSTMCFPGDSTDQPPTLETGSCTPNPPPQTCSGAVPNSHMPPDGLLINWETYVASSGSWGNSAVGDLTGGTSKYNGVMVSPITVTPECDEIRITATIPQYTPDVADDAENYAGLVFWFGPCINASTFGGLSFTVGGSMGGAALKLQVQTSENYPADPANTKGECVFDNCDTRWSDCKGPDMIVPVPEAPGEVTLPWDSFTAGSPNASVNPEGLVGLQFQLECQSQDAECVVDITLGQVNLLPL
jgi:hypothetical protein